MQEIGASAQRPDSPLSAPLPILIRAEQVRLAYRHLPLALLANVVNGLALVAILWNKLPHLVPLVWLSLVVLLSAARYMLTIRYRQSSDLETSPAWEKRFSYGAIAGGVLWGSVPIIMFPANAFAYQAMITIILVGMSAGASVTQSSHRGVLQTYLTLMLLPLIIRLVMEGQPLALMLSAMTALFLVMISTAASLFHRNTIDHIRLGLEAQQREQALKQVEEQYRNLFEMAKDGIFIADMEGSFITTNRIAYERLGYERQELLDMNIAQLLSPKFATDLMSRIGRIQEHGNLFFEAEHICKDGSIMPVEVNAQLIDYRGQKAILGIVRDTSERKRAENRLRTLSRALEQAGESVIITDSNGRVEYVNPAFTIITGYSPEEARGKDLHLLKMNTGRQDASSLYRDMWETVRAGKVWQKELTSRCKDGREISMFMSIAPILDDDGAISHFVGIQQDITEHVKLEERLRQAQKMEAIGTLVGGIAHDFNNMLAGITGNLFLAKQKSLELPEVTKNLEASEKLAFNASKMIQQLLAFARKDIVEIKPLSLNRFMKETSHLYEVSIPESIAHTGIFCDEELLIRGDDTQLQQAIINLLNNARDAVAGVEDPQITLRLEAFDASPEFQRQHNVTARHFARISVEDNGCGIPEDIKARIFEPFFTTKEVGRGTGLGLAMVYGTIASHNGLIDVESEPGSGTAFRIYLPLQSQPEQRLPIASKEESPVPGRGETLLVVDDDPQILEITRHILEALDYRVLTASNGIEAIEIFNGNMDEIKLVVMDLVMPKLGGAGAYEQLHRLNQDVRVIFVTGHDLNQRMESEALHDEAIVLQKPWSTIKLSQTIRTMLDGSPAV